MAKAKGNGVKGGSYSDRSSYTDYEWYQVREAEAQMAEKTYCSLCGGEIYRHSENLDTYKQEMQYQAHLECVRKKKLEMAEQNIERAKAIQAERERLVANEESLEETRKRVQAEHAKAQQKKEKNQ